MEKHNIREKTVKKMDNFEIRNKRDSTKSDSSEELKLQEYEKIKESNIFSNL